MKRSLVVLLLLTSLSLMAVTESFQFATEEIQLKLENIHLKKVSFHKSDLIMVKYSKNAKLTILQSGQVFEIRAPEEVKIRLYLPENKKYLYENEDGICTFDRYTLNFQSDDEFIIISKDGIKVEDRTDGSKVRIDENGIFIVDNNETITITEEGITVDNDDPVHITGPFGSALGFIVRNVTNAAISTIGRTPDKVFKLLINSENKNEDRCHIYWG